jgi:3-hydroxybutyryl-CoA dehydrogenase
MKTVVISNDALKEEWIQQGGLEDAMFEWISEPGYIKETDCYIDLLFNNDADRINKLKKLQPSLIIVNSVIATLKELPENFIRINGWPTFLKRQLVEASCNNNDLKIKAEKIFVSCNKSVEWVPDVPGFISARVISMIINEAYFALDEKVSSKHEIDTAMKLGTNYPYGPFEWSEKIGLKNVCELLTTLSKINSRYEPSALLKKEALLS